MTTPTPAQQEKKESEWKSDLGYLLLFIAFLFIFGLLGLVAYSALKQPKVITPFRICIPKGGLQGAECFMTTGYTIDEHNCLHDARFGNIICGNYVIN